MIHDATGKFSSRRVLPDRSSLALVINYWLHWSGQGQFHAPGVPRTRMDREPHIGEYDTKTNAICDLAHFRLSEVSHIAGPPRRRSDAGAVLLIVVLQHLGACRAQLGTILLKARQDGEVTLIDHRAAVTLDIAVARL